MPLSVAAACKLRDFGGDQGAALSLIAHAFSKGSNRLLDKRGAPPNLPGVGADFTPFHESLEGEELLKKAAEILQLSLKAFQEDRKVNPPPKLSPQILFSSLDEPGLLAMIEIFDVLVVARGSTLVEEGSVGSPGISVLGAARP